MSDFANFSRYSLSQLQQEERRQRAHVRKLSEINHHHHEFKNESPLRFPHIHNGFIKQLNEKRQVIDKENEMKLQKLVNIMMTKNKLPQQVYHPSSNLRRQQTFELSQNNNQYHKRINNVKSTYNARTWEKEYQRHKEYLRIGKDNNVFTPFDMGPNRQRLLKINSLVNSKRTTPTSSTINVTKKD